MILRKNDNSYTGYYVDAPAELRSWDGDETQWQLVALLNRLDQ